MLTQASKKTNRLLQIGLPVLFSGLALWLVLRKLDFQALLSAFRQLSFTSVSLIIILFLLGLLLRGITCWIILGSKFKFSDAFWAMNIGYLLNSFIPLRLGEFGRAAVLTERSKGRAGYMETLASIAGERFLDLLVGFSYLLLSLMFLIENEQLKRIAVLGFVGLAVVLVLAVLMTKNRESVLQRLAKRFPNSDFVHKRVLPSLDNLLLGFQFFLQPSRFIPAFLILAVSWFLSMLEFNVLQNAILESSQWWWPMVVTPASAFVNALPAAPGGLGVFEAGAVGAYALVGVEREAALAMALVVHAVQIIIPAILGIIALFIGGEKLGSLIRRATSFRTQKEELQ